MGENGNDGLRRTTKGNFTKHSQNHENNDHFLTPGGIF